MKNNVYNTLLITIAAILFCIPTFAQEVEAPVDTAWKRGGLATFNITNTGYSDYWQGGGIPSLSFALRSNIFANYKEGSTSWENALALAYGLIRQGQSGSDFIKNEDRIELTSKYGRLLSEKLALSARFNLRTQSAPGYQFSASFPTELDSATQISDFFAPAYINLGIGLDYKPAPNLSINYAPLNGKITIVTIEKYRSLYIPQDGTDEAVRFELGSNLNIDFKKPIAKNVTFQSNANFFTNYLENFGNIDVNWETLTTAKVNDWLLVTFTTNLVYDDDVRFELEDKTTPVPRTQFQHILSIGLTYNFLFD